MFNLRNILILFFFCLFVIYFSLFLSFFLSLSFFLFLSLSQFFTSPYLTSNFRPSLFLIKTEPKISIKIGRCFKNIFVFMGMIPCNEFKFELIVISSSSSLLLLLLLLFMFVCSLLMFVCKILFGISKVKPEEEFEKEKVKTCFCKSNNQPYSKK